jgi:hypothetical protein
MKYDVMQSPRSAVLQLNDLTYEMRDNIVHPAVYRQVVTYIEDVLDTKYDLVNTTESGFAGLTDQLGNTLEFDQNRQPQLRFDQIPDQYTWQQALSDWQDIESDAFLFDDLRKQLNLQLEKRLDDHYDFNHTVQGSMNNLEALVARLLE